MQLFEDRRDRMGNTNPDKPHLMPWGPSDPPLAKRAQEDGKIKFQLTNRAQPDAYKSTVTLFNMNAMEEWKAELYRDVRFRQAYSLFIPRQKINDIMYGGSTMPTLGGFMIETDHPWYYAPLAESPLIERDLDRANALLDELLPNKDADGFRLGPNWAYLWWEWLDSGGENGEEPPQEIKDNWDLFHQMIQAGGRGRAHRADARVVPSPGRAGLDPPAPDVPARVRRVAAQLHGRPPPDRPAVRVRRHVVRERVAPMR